MVASGHVTEMMIALMTEMTATVRSIAISALIYVPAAILLRMEPSAVMIQQPDRYVFLKFVLTVFAVTDLQTGGQTRPRNAMTKILLKATAAIMIAPIHATRMLIVMTVRFAMALKHAVLYLITGEYASPGQMHLKEQDVTTIFSARLPMSVTEAAVASEQARLVMTFLTAQLIHVMRWGMNVRTR